MNLKDMKKKFESGDYILLGSGNRTYYLILNPSWSESCDFYKLIHKKHKHILDTYLEDNNVEIETDSFSESFDFKLLSELDWDFIETYNSNANYRLKITSKPKNNFKDYGFEADFEGEILKVEEHNDGTGTKLLIGYVYGLDFNKKQGYIPVIWTYDGRCITNGHYCLTPLKKEWYENKGNIGKICITTDTEELFFFNGEFENKCVFAINDFKKGNRKDTNWADISRCRPATKEEVLSLLIKE